MTSLSLYRRTTPSRSPNTARPSPRSSESSCSRQRGQCRAGSALRRSGRPVPDRVFSPFEEIDLAPLDAILAEEGVPAGQA